MLRIPDEKRLCRLSTVMGADVFACLREMGASVFHVVHIGADEVYPLGFQQFAAEMLHEPPVFADDAVCVDLEIRAGFMQFIDEFDVFADGVVSLPVGNDRQQTGISRRTAALRYELCRMILGEFEKDILRSRKAVARISVDGVGHVREDMELTAQKEFQIRQFCRDTLGEELILLFYGITRCLKHAEPVVRRKDDVVDSFLLSISQNLKGRIHRMSPVVHSGDNMAVHIPDMLHKITS